MNALLSNDCLNPRGIFPGGRLPHKRRALAPLQGAMEAFLRYPGVRRVAATPGQLLATRWVANRSQPSDADRLQTFPAFHMGDSLGFAAKRFTPISISPNTLLRLP